MLVPESPTLSQGSDEPKAASGAVTLFKTICSVCNAAPGFREGYHMTACSRDAPVTDCDGLEVVERGFRVSNDLNK